jgi:hypothetical protein
MQQEADHETLAAHETEFASALESLSRANLSLTGYTKFT